MADPTPDSGPQKGQLSKEERAAFKNRLDQLGKKLDDATETESSGAQSRSQSGGLGIAMRMGSEFVVAVLIGGAMGWGLDQWLGSTPFMMFLFIMFGFAAGTMNIIRAGKELEKAKTGKESHKERQGNNEKTHK